MPITKALYYYLLPFPQSSKKPFLMNTVHDQGYNIIVVV